jgi:hypothetical protein
VIQKVVLLTWKKNYNYQKNWGVLVMSTTIQAANKFCLTNHPPFPQHYATYHQDFWPELGLGTYVFLDFSHGRSSYSSF